MSHVPQLIILNSYDYHIYGDEDQQVQVPETWKTHKSSTTVHIHVGHRLTG